MGSTRQHSVELIMAGRVRLPSISFIVARSYPGNVIGYKNKLPWRIKSDLKRFRRITNGHAIIMGRSTFEFNWSGSARQSKHCRESQPKLIESDKTDLR